MPVTPTPYLSFWQLSQSLGTLREGHKGDSSWYQLNPPCLQHCPSLLCISFIPYLAPTKGLYGVFQDPSASITVLPSASLCHYTPLQKEDQATSLAQKSSHWSHPALTTAFMMLLGQELLGSPQKLAPKGKPAFQNGVLGPTKLYRVLFHWSPLTVGFQT